ncbi:MAG: hypothetical protein ABIK93_08105 [candidate division WOR-3 bacterium]
MKNRWVLVIIGMLIGLVLLSVGIKLENPAFVHQQSTTLCLSCMGLV